ncbi:sulfatase family protein [Haloferula rosea]|uniref:Arylsulfatase n=1 Tax=Haloferula rosea TaxID=490093 RepID=A0A934R5W1_9BACT|nr:arylsulfatase [Haloferula rosea]MBK1825869.1 arylsulfatase [Haloferula rosea]
MNFFVPQALRLLVLIFLAESTVTARSPNIIVILADDMGYGDVGCYNPRSKIPTPHIDRLAKEGMRFTDAHAAGPLCHPSRYGLMTGRYPFRTDVTRWPKHALIETGQMTLASLLKEHGYHTSMVGKWHLGFEEQGYDRPLPGGPVDCGFDEFFGLRASTDIPPYFFIRNDRPVAPPTDDIRASRSKDWSPIQGKFWREGGCAPGLDLSTVLTTLTDNACSIISRHAASEPPERKPLFLYLALTGPHTPWLPDEQFIGSSGAGLYGDFVAMVDHEVGRVFDALHKADMVDDSLILFTSDNGPVWYEKDVDKFDHDAVGGLRGMKGDAWEGGHRVPFLVRWPGAVNPNSQCSQTIGFTDLLATFSDILGLSLPDEAGPDSFSFLPLLDGSQDANQSVRPALVMKAARKDTMIIRSGRWKFISKAGSGGFSEDPPKALDEPEEQLYDMIKDSSEQVNQVTAHPELVSRLRKELQRIVNTPSHRKSP